MSAHTAFPYLAVYSDTMVDHRAKVEIDTSSSMMHPVRKTEKPEAHVSASGGP